MASRTPRIASLLAATSLVIGVALPAAAQSTPARVEIRQGKLSGVEVDGIKRFLNIPYAASTAGGQRWKPTVPASGWTGERDATEPGPICAQWRAPGANTVPMSEDCLSLNIWTPANRGGRLPVMVWIHGGGFMFGSNREPTYDGARLAEKGVVVVAINYRLGPLGFLAHPDFTAETAYKASGNYGMLDQIEALKWVRDNIAAFGGDPSNVTVFGESAGSTAISILQASPLAKGLFHRAIGQSTSQFDPDGGLVGRKDMRGAEAYGVEFAEKLGARSGAELRALPVEKLLSDLVFMWPTERDGYVLPDIVYSRFAAGLQNDVPLLVGANSDEGSNLQKDWVVRTPQNAADYDRLYGKIDQPLRQSSSDAVQWQMRSWAGLQARTGKSKAWLYWFDQPWPGRKQDGAFHGGEIVYVFRNLDVEKQPWHNEDRRLSELMATYWVNFARNGDPNGAGLPPWPSYNADRPQVMRLSPDPAVISTPRAEAQEFLDRYFDERR